MCSPRRAQFAAFAYLRRQSLLGASQDHRSHLTFSWSRASSAQAQSISIIPRIRSAQRSCPSICRPGIPPARAWDLVSEEAKTLRSHLRPPLDTLLGHRSAAHQEPADTLGPSDTREREWILREASIRTQLASVKGSWRSVASGIRAWGAFMDEFHRNAPHFPAMASLVEGYSGFFQNGGTLSNYLAHLEFAHLLTRNSFINDPVLLRRLKNGPPPNLCQ